jgi:hypothetical protein
MVKQFPDVVLAGTPCQPWSRQGQQRNFADPRAWVLIAILQSAALSGAKILAVECAEPFAQCPAVKACLDTFTQTVNWQYHFVILDSS